MSADEANPLFLCGGAYAPVVKATEAPMEEWAADIRRMKDMGFTGFRSFAAWDRIERREGTRDYAMLDTALALAERNGLQVMVSVGGVFDNPVGLYPPRWLVRDHPVQHCVEDPRAEGRPCGPRRDICMDDPIYREKADDFLVETVRRYAHNPTIHSWVVWNEPRRRIMCRCPHTQEAFRRWLRKRYGDSLSALNAAWGTEFPVDFESWEEIEPPMGFGFLAGGANTWLDWRRFLKASLTEAIVRTHRLVKENDALRRPTTVNMRRDDLGDDSADASTDVGAIGRVVDVLGYSHYTPSPRCNLPHIMAARLDRIRSASRHPQGKFFVVEYEAGPWGIGGDPPRYTDIPDRVLRDWHAIGHGAASLMGWMYRSRVQDTQAGGFALTGMDGSETERARAAGRTAKDVSRLSAMLAARRPRPGRVAIVADSDACLVARTVGHLVGGNAREDSFWYHGWIGTHKLLRDARIPCDFLDYVDVQNGKLSGYRAAIVPAHIGACAAAAAALTAYVREGGLLIADAPFALTSERCQLLYPAPGHGLDKVFGFTAATFDPAEGDMIVLDARRFGAGIRLRSSGCKQPLNLCAGTRVLGAYASGEPAIVENSFGRGRAVYVATSVLGEYARKDWRRIQYVVTTLLREQGVDPSLRVAPEGGFSSVEAELVEICELVPEDIGGETAYLVVNHNCTPVAVRVTVADNRKAVRDVLRHGAVTCRQQARNLEISVALEAKGCMLLHDGE